MLVVNLALKFRNQTFEIFLKASLSSGCLHLSNIKSKKRKQLSVEVEQLPALPRFCSMKTELYFGLDRNIRLILENFKASGTLATSKTRAESPVKGVADLTYSCILFEVYLTDVFKSLSLAGVTISPRRKSPEAI